MDKPARFTPQMQQELISRFQLCERFVRFGWLPNSPILDLGQDFKIDVYFQGQAAEGINFYVQEKSVINLNERRRGEYLVYDFEVKDLKHWETFSVPVVLIVWDIELRQGRWALVDRVIEDLDQRRPNWRNNKSKVSVYIPWDNATDDAGLVKLKQGIGHRLFPIIARDRPLEIQFKREFPNTDEGRVAYEAIDRAIKEGEPITIQGFRELNFSNWFMSWFGEFDPQKATISLGPPPSARTFLVRIDMISTLGETAILPIVELKMIKVGSEVAQLSNKHQDSPLHFLFKVPDLTKTKEGTVTISLNHLGHNVYETRDVSRFLRAVTTGGELRLTPLTEDKPPIIVSVSRNLGIKPPLQFMQLIDKVCTIQDKISQFLRMPDEGPTDADIQAINELVAITEHGKTLAKAKEITWEFKEKALDILLGVHRHNKPSHFTIPSTESWVELFGVEISTGPMTRHVTGKIAMSLDELEKAITTLTPGEYLSIKFVNVEIVEVFPNWFVREAQRLSQLLAEKFGVEAVYLFGSLVWNDVHAPETDIDLAISGLPKEQFLEAVSYLEQESKFPIDLVDLSKIPDHLNRRILTEGKLLYEREPVAAFG